MCKAITQNSSKNMVLHFNMYYGSSEWVAACGQKPVLVFTVCVL